MAHAKQNVGFAPCTPSGQATSGFPTSPGSEAAMLCPQPHKLFMPPSTGSHSPGEDNLNLHSPGFSNDQARNEFCEVLSGGAGAGNGGQEAKAEHAQATAGTQHGDHRPLSAISTSCGATPSPDGRVSPQQWSPAPESQRQGSPTTATGACAVSAQQRRNRGGVYKAPRGDSQTETYAGGCCGGPSSSAGNAARQTGKIFVGGVPQEMNQDELYKLFSQFGAVKKAWLQSFRAPVRMNQSPPHNHRGFGFVIFYDSQSVDTILGPMNPHSPSGTRHLNLADGRKVEVKRAVASSEIPVKLGPTGSPQQSGHHGGHQGPTSSPNLHHGRGGMGGAGCGGCCGGPAAFCGVAPHGSPVTMGGMMMPGQRMEVGMVPPLPLAAHPGHTMLPLQANFAGQQLQQGSGEGWAGAAAVHACQQVPGAPWATSSDPRIPQGHVAAPWPTSFQSASSLAAAQAMTMPQSMGHHTMSTPHQQMMMQQVAYPGPYAGLGFPQQAVGQPGQPHVSIQQGMPAGGFVHMMAQHGPVAQHGAVQHTSVFQPHHQQPRIM
eukprot:CAMPEP_0177178334 /NCGR_PEP_ID=MMETSP0367-20130122/14275_1 /TAXON_ID=447022 ORGANISM="Scrippsiella hangoei-like, Strain SHHI-4" /NCGR_SAMPLE_ID=MMETSP0367 /ASSEMBLY_ACC=CAM_ASM_000362 /LENGTH=545 /DNA_ID=CAMNT_0018624989 /DNA_START=66 /DNA_END=1703 /DNA_ORIENTATION=-